MSTVPRIDDCLDDTLVAEVESQVKAWLDAASHERAHPSAQRLADVLKDPHGLEFTVGFVDRVVRPEDQRVAARALRELVPLAPTFLPRHLKAALRLGAALSVVAPWLVIPVARRVLRQMVAHLLIDARETQVGRHIARLTQRGVRLNINLLGEAVLGEVEANQRLEGTRRLLQRPDVDYVSIKVSSPVAPHSPWAYGEAVEQVVERLLPLYRYAAAESAAGRRKFINLDMEEYPDLDITVEVFQRLLDRDELLGLEAGIALQAYLPDAMGVMIRLQEWSAARRVRGGAPIKVRLVKGANLPMERIQASLHGWPLVTWASKRESDTCYKAVLEYALRPERVANVRLGVAGHNLFDVAYAWVLAGRRQVRDAVEFEMLLGMAESQAGAVRRTVGGLLLYVPVVHPQDFDVAIAYLVRRLEEGASHDNFMSAVFDIHDDADLYARERQRFLDALSAVPSLAGTVPAPNRTQDRRAPVPTEPRRQFASCPDTDPSLPGNRVWGRGVIAAMADGRLGVDLVAAHTIDSVAQIEQIIDEVVAAAPSWGALSAAARATVLRRAAVELERRRGDLLAVAGSECGKTLDQGDPEVSEAIDFCTYYAASAEGLARTDGAEPVPVRLTVVVPPWNFPIAIPAGGIAAALAAGSGVIVKPAPQARRCGSVVVEALWAAGVPRDVLRLAHVRENEGGQALVGSPKVDRLILTGAFETAALFRSFRTDLPLLAETSGKNSIIITPDADLDLAVKDLVVSAFGHAGQKCSAASLGILVGSVERSERLRSQLVDAVTSLKVGQPWDPTSQVGPIIEPAAGKLLRALTTLAPGETWLVAPRRLDAEGRLWSPGVKTGVRRGSEYHLTEYFGPVLGLIAADTLAEAIEIQNETAYGLTAGLHSLERAEVQMWLDRVEAGNAYVNRTTVGAIVRRQPFGGWKKSAVGPGAKAGGPNYLVGLTDWLPRPATRAAALGPAVLDLLASAQAAGLDSDGLLSRAFGSDAHAWADEFGVAKDVCGLLAEKNVLRFRPVPVTVRVEEPCEEELVRIVGAGLACGVSPLVSLGTEIRAEVRRLLARVGVRVIDQGTASWAAVLQGPGAPARVRLIGSSAADLCRLSRGRPDVAVYDHPVVEAGRVEMLPFVREQAIAITAHRFGTPTALADTVAT